MADLKPCKHCGGNGEIHYEYIDTAFGARKGIAVQCTECNARTSLYMCGEHPEEYEETVVDLWNRGRTGRHDDDE